MSRIVRNLVGLALFAGASSVFGQTLPLSSDVISTHGTLAYNQFRTDYTNSRGELSFGLRGTTDVTINGVRTTYTTIVGWFAIPGATAPTYLCEVQTWKGSTQIYRVIADGTTVYGFDIPRNEYSSTPYNTYQGAQSRTYAVDFVNSIKKVVPEVSSSTLRQAIELGFGQTGNFQNWLPGVRGMQVDNSTTPGVINYNFETGDRTRSMRLLLTTNPVLNQWFWNETWSYEWTRVGSGSLETNTLIILNTNTDGSALRYRQDSPFFVFVPPAGSRAIARPRTVRLTGG
jgi:hypothetical protein